MMKINQLKAGAILTYFSMGLGYLVAIIYTPLMLRLLGQSEYGLYNLVASVVAYLGILNFGFGSAYMRYYSRYKVKEDREKIAMLNGMFLIIFSILGLVSVIAGTVLALGTGTILGNKLTGSELSKAKILMLILVLNLALSFPSIVFNTHITANEKFVFQKVLLMIKIVTNPFVVLPLLLMGYGSVGMVIATTVLHLVIEIANVSFCIVKLQMKFSLKRFDFCLMREMTVFSSFIFINLIIDQINWNVDKLILGRFYGTITVAVYGLAAQLNTYYLSLSGAISNVFVPRVHKMVATTDDNEQLAQLFARIGRIQFLVLSLIFSGLVFFGRPFIRLWAGTDYSDSYPIALLLIIPATIPLIQNIGIEIQRAKNMHQFRSWVYFFIALANLAISIPLAKAYGGVGVAIGTATALILGNGIIMNWYYHIRVRLNMVYFWKQIFRFFPALIIPSTYGIAVNYFLKIEGVPLLLILGIGYVAVFSISMWLFGLNEYEKDHICKPLKRIWARVTN